MVAAIRYIGRTRATGEFHEDFVAKLRLGEGFYDQLDATELFKFWEIRLQRYRPRVLVEQYAHARAAGLIPFEAGLRLGQVCAD